MQLEVTDSHGRTVTDDANVEIELSLRNHVPVIVGHPDGGDAVYGGYIGTPIILDGRTTYDVDTEHVVFPGDANRPRGVADRITSIHFDLNLDGDYDDAGEDGTLGPVTFVPRPGQALGDRIAVRNPAPTMSMKASRIVVAPNSPSSSPMAAKMKSLSTTGTVSGRPRPTPVPATPPHASANQAWITW